MKKTILILSGALALCTSSAIAGYYGDDGVYHGSPALPVKDAFDKLHGAQLANRIEALLNSNSALIADVIRLIAAEPDNSDRQEAITATKQFILQLNQTDTANGQVPPPAVALALASPDAHATALNILLASSFSPAPVAANAQNNPMKVAVGVGSASPN